MDGEVRAHEWTVRSVRANDKRGLGEDGLTDWSVGAVMILLFAVTTPIVLAVWIAAKKWFLKARPSSTRYESALTAPPLGVKKPDNWFWKVSYGLQVLGGIAAACLFAWRYLAFKEVDTRSFFAAVVLGLPVFLVEQLEDESPVSPLVRRVLTWIWKVARALVWIEGLALAAVVGFFALTWGSEVIESLTLRAIGLIIIVLLVILILQQAEKGQR